MAFSDDKIVPVLIRSSSAMFPRIHLPTPAPINRPSSAPVSSATLSFSVGRILAMEDGLARRSFPASTHKNPAVVSKRRNHNEGNEAPDHFKRLDDDNPTSDVDSPESGRVTPISQRSKKKIQRTTFSPVEVWELERAFVKRPYLRSQDEEELVQKLGLTARNIRFWFQNRRARLRREERKLAIARQSGQFDHMSSPTNNERLFAPPVYHLGGPPQTPFVGPVQREFFPTSAAYSPASFRSSCPCCSVNPNWFEALGPQSTVRQEYLSDTSDQLEELPFSMPMLPRLHPSQFLPSGYQPCEGIGFNHESDEE